MSFPTDTITFATVDIIWEMECFLQLSRTHLSILAHLPPHAAIQRFAWREIATLVKKKWSNDLIVITLTCGYKQYLRFHNKREAHLFFYAVQMMVTIKYSGATLWHQMKFDIVHPITPGLFVRQEDGSSKNIDNNLGPEWQCRGKNTDSQVLKTVQESPISTTTTPSRMPVPTSSKQSCNARSVRPKVPPPSPPSSSPIGRHQRDAQTTPRRKLGKCNNLPTVKKATHNATVAELTERFNEGAVLPSKMKPAFKQAQVVDDQSKSFDWINPEHAKVLAMAKAITAEIHNSMDQISPQMSPYETDPTLDGQLSSSCDLDVSHDFPTHFPSPISHQPSHVSGSSRLVTSKDPKPNAQVRNSRVKTYEWRIQNGFLDLE